MIIPQDYERINKQKRPLTSFGLGIDEPEYMNKDNPRALPVRMKKRLMQTGRVIVTLMPSDAYGTLVVSDPNSKAEIRYWVRYRGFGEDVIGRIVRTYEKGNKHHLLNVPDENGRDLFYIHTLSDQLKYLVQPFERVSTENFIRI